MMNPTPAPVSSAVRPTPVPVQSNPPLRLALTESSPLRQEMIPVLPSLRARALKLCLNRAEADDLLQDTVLRALRFESSYQPGTNIRAWLHQILFSVFITGCRRIRRERRALESLTVDPCAWTHRDAPPPMQQLSPRVEGAIQALPRQFAAVIRLVDLQEQSYKDAAAQLQVPVGTVMSRLFRGRRLLACTLEPEPEPTARAA
jgi:RNA polymerase sigma-70 factor (ECF subfamily)